MNAVKTGHLDKFVQSLAVVTALIGGFVLMLLVLITVISVIGRSLISLGLGPIPGDFEIIEAGIAFAVFACLPWCQLNRGHASVELLTERMGPTTNKVLDLLIDLLMVFVAGMMTRQLYFGALDKHAYGETSFILGFPIWWAYAACLLGAIVFFIVCLYCLWQTGLKILKDTK